jgi:hypothetical protein
VLDAVQGSEPGDLFLAPPPARSYKAEIAAHPGKLRIGMLTRASFGHIHPECLTATNLASKLLESFGHELDESYPESLFEEPVSMAAENRLLSVTPRSARCRYRGRMLHLVPHESVQSGRTRRVRKRTDDGGYEHHIFIESNAHRRHSDNTAYVLANPVNNSTLGTPTVPFTGTPGRTTWGYYGASTISVSAATNGVYFDECSWTGVIGGLYPACALGDGVQSPGCVAVDSRGNSTVYMIGAARPSPRCCSAGANRSFVVLPSGARRTRCPPRTETLRLCRIICIQPQGAPFN